MAVMLCVGMVLAFELVNSALEYLCNIVQPEQHQKIKGIKDMAAAAVLVVALVSIVVGCLVFLPHLISG
jgi:diacylglycerol kinase